MRRCAETFVLVLFALAFTIPRAAAREIHVAVTGDDRNGGSAEEPLRTISAAARLAQPGDVITVHGGTYRERVTPPRGGSSDAERITYRAAPGEKVEIKGSEVVKGWKPDRGNVWKVVLPNAFFGDDNPYAERIEGDWFSPRSRTHHTGEVYLNGIPLWEAARLEDVYTAKDGKRWWYGEVDDQNTVLWADFGPGDPNQELVEINVRPACFYPDRPGVNYITVRGFIMRHAATQWAPPTAEQIGLVGTHWSKGWIIEDNVISDSRCTGITLGKYHDPLDRREASAGQYNETIRQALEHGWSKEHIGSHIVRHNTIYRCEQAGICGSMGGAFSVVTGNHIYDVWVKRLFAGAEIAGIKLHGAIDTVISHNHIHCVGRGIWLDWMAQGARVTANLLYDNSTEDMFFEVNHGPLLVDNNILFSPVAFRIMSEGGAFAHNLVAGAVLLHPELRRRTPFHKPHSTELAGLSVTRCGDDRWYNNLFTGRTGLIAYDEVEQPVWMAGNVFLADAQPSKHEKAPVVEPQAPGSAELVARPEGKVRLKMRFDDRWLAPRDRRLVTTQLLGKARLPKQGYTRPDGRPLKIDADYFGRARNATNPAPGPLARPKPGTWDIQVWPKSLAAPRP
ncbi:MAG TPA: DUF1565 domain-containing protein [Planctomycetaceae bacterium]|nr:DUF1565 domain-containing protein [Planctomycetaceae bacterium]